MNDVHSKSINLAAGQSILLIEDQVENHSPLSIALKNIGHQITQHIETNELNKKLADNVIINQQQTPNYDLLIINTLLPDQRLITSLTKLYQIAPLPIVLFAKQQNNDLIKSIIEAGVSVYMPEQFQSQSLTDLIAIAKAQFIQAQSLRNELDKVTTQLANRKIIERAKGYLMQQKSLSEQAAFALLRNMAMNNGQTIASVSKTVTEVYG